MDWDPGPKYQLYLDRITSIQTGEQRTVRDVYYALEARGFESELAEYGFDFDYRYVKRAVKKGRRAGYIDPGSIIDTSRRVVTEERASHADPERWLRNRVRYINNGYFQNHWDDQPKYVEVWLEKASLASVFQPICDDLNVRLEATRGDWSDSKVYEATQRLSDAMERGKQVVILYFGDFNPSGLHAPVAVQKTMSHYGIDLNRNWDDEQGYFDIWPWSGPLTATDWHDDATMLFDRKALNLDHIERFDLPENPTPSSSDKDRTLRDRFMKHAADGRDVNIELNALKEYEREFLEDLVRDSIEAHIDEEIEASVEERERARQETIRTAVDVDYSVFE